MELGLTSTTIFQVVSVAVFTAIAMATDLRNRKIPNWLTVTAAICGLLFHVCVLRLPGLWFSLGGFAVGFGILFVLWIIGGGGAGDVKLMGAVGAWLGPKYTFAVFLLSVVCSLLCMLAVIGYGLVSNKNKTSTTNLLKKKIPYAVPCGLSAWAVLLVQLFADRQ